MAITKASLYVKDCSVWLEHLQTWHNNGIRWFMGTLHVSACIHHVMHVWHTGEARQRKISIHIARHATNTRYTYKKANNIQWLRKRPKISTVIPTPIRNYYYIISSMLNLFTLSISDLSLKKSERFPGILWSPWGRTTFVCYPLFEPSPCGFGILDFLSKYDFNCLINWDCVFGFSNYFSFFAL